MKITISEAARTMMSDSDYQQPEDNEALQFWMWCEEQKEKEQHDEN